MPIPYCFCSGLRGIGHQWGNYPTCKVENPDMKLGEPKAKPMPRCDHGKPIDEPCRYCDYMGP